MFNLAIFNHTISARLIVMRGKKRSTCFVSQNQKIQLWHQCLTYVRNTKVVKVSKLVDDINIGFKKYDSAEVFIYSKNFKIFSDKNKLLSNSILQPALLKLAFLSIEIKILSINSVF